MPACTTSLLRDEVPVPMPSAASTTTTSRPASASAFATARPTTPAPTTRQSIRSTATVVAVSGLAGRAPLGRGANRAQRGPAGDHVGVEAEMDQRRPARRERRLERRLEGGGAVYALPGVPAVGAGQGREIRIAEVASGDP